MHKEEEVIKTKVKAIAKVVVKVKEEGTFKITLLKCLYCQEYKKLEKISVPFAIRRVTSKGIAMLTKRLKILYLKSPIAKLLLIKLAKQKINIIIVYSFILLFI